jgi:hypothetical protein
MNCSVLSHRTKFEKFKNASAPGRDEKANRAEGAVFIWPALGDTSRVPSHGGPAISDQHVNVNGVSQKTTKGEEWDWEDVSEPWVCPVAPPRTERASLGSSTVGKLATPGLSYSGVVKAVVAQARTHSSSFNYLM